MIFVVLGNLSGNALAFGLYVMRAMGHEQNHDSAIRGLAVVSMTATCVLHAVWRAGGIWLNNIFAIVKTALLLAVIAVGFAAAGGAHFGKGPIHGTTINAVTHSQSSNFDIHSSFASPSRDTACYVNSLLFVVYTFSGWEQPFYVSQITAANLMRTPLKCVPTGFERSQEPEKGFRQVSNRSDVPSRIAVYAC